MTSKPLQLMLSRKWIRFRLPFCIAVCLFVAACVAVGDIHQYADSDGIIQVLISTQHWTPFYWGQNRFGMFFPLLALPIKNPFLNLCFQSTCSFFTFFLGIFLASRWLYPDKLWPAIASLSLILLLGSYPEQRLLLISYNPQASSLGLCLAGIMVISMESSSARRDKYLFSPKTFGVVLIFIAIWLNPTIVLSIVPLIIIKGFWGMVAVTSKKEHRDSLNQPYRLVTQELTLPRFTYSKDTFLQLGVLVLALGIMLFWMHCYGGQRYGLLPLAESLKGCKKISQNLFALTFSGNHSCPIVIASIISLIILAFLGRNSNSAHIVRRSLVGCGFAVLAEILAAGTNEHVKQNLYEPRYVTVSFILILLTLVGTVLTVSFSKLADRRKSWLNLISLILVVIVAVSNFGLPSFKKMQKALDVRCGKYTKDVIDAGCTHFAGDYWRVWLTVFHANMTYYNRGLNKMIWGISFRSIDTQKLWLKQTCSKCKVGVATDDLTSKTIRIAGWPLVQGKELNSVTIYPWPAMLSSQGQIQFDKCFFRSQIGGFFQDSGSLAIARKNCSQPGFLIYGPHVFLPRGRYSITVILKALNVDTNHDKLGWFDIMAGGQEYWKVELRRKDFTDSRLDLIHEFNVQKDFANWEFRIYYFPVSDFTVDKIFLRRLHGGDDMILYPKKTNTPQGCYVRQGTS